MQGFILNPMVFLVALFVGVILLTIYLSRDPRVKHAPDPSYKIGTESMSDKLLLAAEEGKPVDSPDMEEAEEDLRRTGGDRPFI